MKKSSPIFGINVSFFLSSLVLAALASPSFAHAEGYFPDLNTDRNFRDTVEKAIASEALTFTYDHPLTGKQYEYYVTYGGDYDFTREMYSRMPIPATGEAANTRQEDRLFRFLREKAIYVSRSTPFQDTNKYEIFTRRPKLPPELLQNLDPLQPIPYVFGSPLCQIKSAKNCIRFTTARNYPKLQGPYFYFTLTALNEVPSPSKEYERAHAKWKGVKMVRDLITQFIIEKINSSQELKDLRAEVFAKAQERSKLLTDYTQLYRLKAIERAKQETGNDLLPEGTLVHIKREDLTVGQSHELAKVEADFQDLQAKLILLYSHEVTAHLTFENLVPYIQLNSDKGRVLERSKDASLEEEEEEDQSLSYEFIVSALKNFGPPTYAAVRKQQGF